MKRSLVLIAAVSLSVVLVGVAIAEKTSEKAVDVLEGTLRVHPKFHYRYYIDGFGSAQTCALFQADKTLKLLDPGIRVRGNLARKFFGKPNDENSALAATWIIYMNVDEVAVLQENPR